MAVPVTLADLDRFLAFAERATSLLERCLPANASSEIQRVAELWERGEPGIPDFEYRPPPELGPLLTALEGVASGADTFGPLGLLYAERARELWTEAKIVDSLCSPAFAAFAAARFPRDETAYGLAADVVAREFAELSPPETEKIAADDESDTRSLVSQIARLVGAARLPFRITTSEQLASAAATGDGLIVVRAGARHTAASGLRIALHEVHGHALPRFRARSESLGLFAIGTARGTDDEEGRALLIEERHGLLCPSRGRELGVRHLAADAVRHGADWVDAVRLVTAYGVPARDAVRICARVCRGGGLARELVYLPALLRVRAAFAEDAETESWLERGRVAVSAVSVLRDGLDAGPGGSPPTSSTKDHRKTAMTGV